MTQTQASNPTQPTPDLAAQATKTLTYLSQERASALDRARAIDAIFASLASSAERLGVTPPAPVLPTPVLPHVNTTTVSVNGAQVLVKLPLPPLVLGPNASVPDRVVEVLRRQPDLNWTPAQLTVALGLADDYKAVSNALVKLLTRSDKSVKRVSRGVYTLRRAKG